jgi:hypothetical protein
MLQGIPDYCGNDRWKSAKRLMAIGSYTVNRNIRPPRQIGGAISFAAISNRRRSRYRAAMADDKKSHTPKDSHYASLPRPEAGR